MLAIELSSVCVQSFHVRRQIELFRHLWSGKIHFHATTALTSITARKQTCWAPRQDIYELT